MKPLMALLAVLSFTACGNDRQYEVYPDLVRQWETSSNVYLTAQNHPHGWGRADCYRCHVQRNIHMKDWTSDQSVDWLLPIAREANESECKTCHDTNGVQP
ncbi:MAG TPA: hypothetical protein DCS07_03740 [Bdellovibrionales bacterium]|nr:hypothetical protein [Bdellovibrionales bacterium]